MKMVYSVLREEFSMLKKTAAILIAMILSLPFSPLAFTAENTEAPSIDAQPSGATVLQRPGNLNSDSPPLLIMRVISW